MPRPCHSRQDIPTAREERSVNKLRSFACHGGNTMVSASESVKYCWKLSSEIVPSGLCPRDSWFVSADSKWNHCRAQHKFSCPEKRKRERKKNIIQHLPQKMNGERGIMCFWILDITFSLAARARDLDDKAGRSNSEVFNEGNCSSGLK